MRRLVILLFCILWCSAGAEDWKVIEPETPVIGQEREEVLIRLQGPVGERPVLALGSARFALTESAPGLYSGLFRVGTKAQSLGLVVGQKTIDLGRVEPDSNTRYFIAHQESVTRQGPLGEYDRLTPIYPQTKVRIDGTRGGWHRAGSGAELCRQCW